MMGGESAVADSPPPTDHSAMLQMLAAGGPELRAVAEDALATAVKDELDRVEAAERWLRNYADSLDTSYGNIMEYADDVARSDRDPKHYHDYLVRGDDYDGMRVPEEFWSNYEVVRGVQLQSHDHNFLSCSC